MKQETNKKYPFAVYATAFHGGRFISRHATLERAEMAVKRYRMADCTCGCAGIINENAGDKPGTYRDQESYSNPYAIGCV
jgi:hypothetical protein